MSGADLVKEAAGALPKIFRGLLGWIVIAPLARTIRKKKELLVVIGRDDGKFLDNAKYFFLQAAPLLKPVVRVVFVTEREDAAGLLCGSGYEAQVYPSRAAIWTLIRAGVLVVDSSEWVWRFRRFFLVGSRKIQLWHGVGYKRIELDKWRNEAIGSILAAAWMPRVRRMLKRVNGRLVRFDVVNTTSEFYKKEVFEPAMLSSHFLVAGYPRNTFGNTDESIGALAWKNVDRTIASRVAGWLEEGRRIVLVTPTYKDTRASRIGLDAEALGALSAFCRREKVEFVFKFHPLEHGVSCLRGEHLHLCDPISDLYPLMPLSSALITDYSSIYMDYLLLDKPVLFLVPDLEEYMSKDRQLQFDFDKMTPGAKCETWSEVLESLSNQWRHDDYADERAKLRRLAFDDLPQEQAVPKLIAFMRARGWLAAEPGDA